MMAVVLLSEDVLRLVCEYAPLNGISLKENILFMVSCMVTLICIL